MDKKDYIKNIETGVKESSSGDFYCFFADPAEHSLSPLMYNTLFREFGVNACYRAFRVPEGEIGSAMELVRALNIKGCNISMPHKTVVMDYLDEIDESAMLCNAVNTIVNEDRGPGKGKLVGYNTDSIGAVSSLREMGYEIKGANIVLLGLGGAGQAVLVGLAKESPECISIFVRPDNEAKHLKFARKISEAFPGLVVQVCNLESEGLLRERIDDSTILINCTSVGMGNLEGKSLIPDSNFLHKNLYVMDAIYSPAKTKLLEQAKAAGCKRYKNGLDMLIYQGEAAFKLYTGIEAQNFKSIVQETIASHV